MNQVPENTLIQAVPRSQAGMPDNRTVPFDQLVTFNLTNKRHNVLTRVINISIEGIFVAVAMSYSILPEVQLVFGPEVEDHVQKHRLGSFTIAGVLKGFRKALEQKAGQAGLKLSEPDKIKLEEQLLRNGFQLNPSFEHFVLSQVEEAEGGRDYQVPEDIRNQLFQVVACRQAEVNFLYSISDNATNREFQSEPIHNIAGLGIANGDRPFRFFPQPIIFEPRSVIRVQITEISGRGQLYIVLQGYKVLGTRPQLTE